ncbi:hypothetical protein THRCLA_03176 [Thraustotheca clavata]|uniref:Uncharacterized protein n=1 Tax=Thraustotheca clavata TaxID=74557 RepID=A0A1W0A337_9STRA|nr:hypothetical protein THRCLA_03176 [Thraustotheca clavata]
MQQVLQSKDLLRTIVAYQNGLHPDVLPLARFLSQIRLRQGHNDAEFRAFHRLIAPWLRVHGTAGLELFPTTLNGHLFYYSLALGNEMVLAFLHSKSALNLDDSDWELIITYGHVQVLEFLLGHGYEGCSADTMSQAIEAGQLDMVECLHKNGVETSKEAFNEACVNGHAQIAQFLHQNSLSEWDPNTFMFVLVNGHLDIVQFLYENGYESFDSNTAFGFDVSGLDIVAKCGHLDVVEYLFDQKPRQSIENAMVEAAKAGHLDIIKFLDGKQVTWKPVNVVTQAIKYNRLQVVKYLLQSHQAQMDKETLANIARKHRRQSILTFLQAA